MHNRISFTGATIKGLNITPSERGATSVLIIEAPINQEIATLMNAGHLYKENGDPWANVDAVSLTGSLRDVDFALPTPAVDGQYELHRPTIIHKFKIHQESEVALSVSFRVVCPEKCLDDLALFVKKWNKDTFECAIRSLQEEFLWNGEDAGGSEVDMSGEGDSDEEPTVTGPLFTCASCEAEIPLDESATNHTTEDGEVIPCQHPSAATVRGDAPVDDAPLPSVRQMGVKGKGKRKLSRAEQAEAERGAETTEQPEEEAVGELA